MECFYTLQMHEWTCFFVCFYSLRDESKIFFFVGEWENVPDFVDIAKTIFSSF